MFNWIKGGITALFLLVVVHVFGQCIGCPPLSGGSVPVPTGSFNGQTSSVTTYNGATPTCYKPTSGGLNGHLQGINNSLCSLRSRLDSLIVASDNDSLITVLQGEIDSIAGLLRYYDVVSTDSSVSIEKDTVDGVIVFNLSVPKVTVNVDASCLGIYTNDLDSILQALIDLNCDTIPLGYFNYCMSPTFDLFSDIVGFGGDTLAGGTSCGGICPLTYIGTQYQAHIYNSYSPNVTDESTPFRFCPTVAYTCDQIDACLQDTLYSAGQCAIINYFNIEANGVGYSSIDSALCFGNTNNIPSQTYLLDVVDGDTTMLYQILTTINSDTTIRQDISIPFNETENKVLRTLGCVYSGLAIDTINSTVTITATPSKTSETTYQASSFKIEKIAFADISAGTISGSTYNPILGQQSNTFALTTGKNTFKISVEDTDGNIAYSIFQVTKTPQ